MKCLPLFIFLAMPGMAAAQLTYSFYEQSPHNATSYMNSDNFSFSDSGNCHTVDGVTGSWAFYSNLFLCANCHVNESGPPYTLYAAPAMEVHSAAAIAGDAKGTLNRWYCFNERCPRRVQVTYIKKSRQTRSQL